MCLFGKLSFVNFLNSPVSQEHYRNLKEASTKLMNYDRQCTIHTLIARIECKSGPFLHPVHYPIRDGSFTHWMRLGRSALAPVGRKGGQSATPHTMRKTMEKGRPLMIMLHTEGGKGGWGRLNNEYIKCASRKLAFRIKAKYLWSAANRLLLYYLYGIKLSHKSSQKPGSGSLLACQLYTLLGAP